MFKISGIFKVTSNTMLLNLLIPALPLCFGTY